MCLSLLSELKFIYNMHQDWNWLSRQKYPWKAIILRKSGGAISVESTTAGEHTSLFNILEIQNHFWSDI